MTPERWHRIETLFEQALERPESERTAFLDQVRAGEPDLYSELVELLASTLDAGTSLRNAVVAEAQVLASDAATVHVGRRIGPFRLLALLGRGGMGAVYLAERDDAQFHHRVAIKILPHAVGTPDEVARFRDERQILAALEHPNIVRLLDGGNTDDGLPYLAMEHIEGATITQYATDHELPVRARLALVRQVCAALQYAHQNLVVHRDIKPGNILVDATGTPKVLDFGIAKLLLPIPGFERARTVTGTAMFTPEYASPEQARGDAVSTATDVYSIGAVLYELMAGRPPHLPIGNVLENLRTIYEVDPPRPSAAAPRARRGELAGDLDNIILKALHKEPARRYASMEALSDDLERFLEGRPVTARTATFGYRARKFVRRNKAVVIATTLVIVTLLTATIDSRRHARLADEQAQIAAAEAQRADEQKQLAAEQAERAKKEGENAVVEARRAEAEAKRAREAEAKVKEQLDQLQTEQAARAAAENDAQVKRVEAERLAAQLKVALAKARQETLLAEQESARAREAEARAEAAARREKEALEGVKVLLQKEQAHSKALEEHLKEITTGPL